MSPIILVDDSADDLVFARRRLDRSGIANPVVTFLSSEDAIAHLSGVARARQADAALFPCFLFLDIRMPKLGGFEMLRWLRRQEAFGAVPVAMLSGSDEPRDRELAARLGANHYLVKFPPPQLFAEIVTQAMNRR